MQENYEEMLTQVKERLEDYLKEAVSGGEGPAASLWEAMRYSLLADGKRIRPLLLILTGRSLGAPEEDLYPFAAALEMIHTYSLIHDDLPAMDNDDYRRGRLTNHKVFGEAGAILAGDGLLNLAYETAAEAVAQEPSLRKVLALTTLAHAAGPQGMIAGQTADLAAEGQAVGLEELDYIERHKTGCLLSAPLVMAGILAGAPTGSVERLERAGQAMGRAFQIWDDILDVEGSFEELGKPLHSDEESGKATFVSCFGLEEAKKEAERLTETALTELEFLPGEAGGLVRELTRALILRRK